MTRTHIITADGTHFVPLTARTRLRNRILGGIALLITALFLSAAIIGLQKAAIAESAPRIAPTASSTISLAAAQKACRKAPRGATQDCLALYMRSAWASPSTFTPKGAILVGECFSQYKGRELRDCFTQEIG